MIGHTHPAAGIVDGQGNLSGPCGRAFKASLDNLAPQAHRECGCPFTVVQNPAAGKILVVLGLNFKPVLHELALFHPSHTSGDFLFRNTSGQYPR